MHALSPYYYYIFTNGSHDEDEYITLFYGFDFVLLSENSANFMQPLLIL
jgi:hypothetical protein